MFIEKSALVEPGAIVGENTKIWHHAHVRSGASLGDNCVIGKGVYIDTGVVVGSGVKIQNYVSLYNGVTIEDDVFLGPQCVFTNDLRPRASTVNWEIVPTLVRQGASVGANATVICGVTIDRWSMVGAGAVLTRSTRPYELVTGIPARNAGWVCTCGQPLEENPMRDKSGVIMCKHHP